MDHFGYLLFVHFLRFVQVAPRVHLRIYFLHYFDGAGALHAAVVGGEPLVLGQLFFEVVRRGVVENIWIWHLHNFCDLVSLLDRVRAKDIWVVRDEDLGLSKNIMALSYLRLLMIKHSHS